MLGRSSSARGCASTSRRRSNSARRRSSRPPSNGRRRSPRTTSCDDRQEEVQPRGPAGGGEEAQGAGRARQEGSVHHEGEESLHQGRDGTGPGVRTGQGGREERQRRVLPDPPHVAPVRKAAVGATMERGGPTAAPFC